MWDTREQYRKVRFVYGTLDSSSIIMKVSFGYGTADGSIGKWALYMGQQVVV